MNISHRVQDVIRLALVTFAEGFLAVLVGGSLVGMSMSVLQMAAIAGIGAALSVCYNALRNYRKEVEDDAAEWLDTDELPLEEVESSE